MKVFFMMLALWVSAQMLQAQEDDLRTYQAELERACRSGHPDSMAAAYCHLGEYYAYRNTDSTRYFCEKGLKYARDTYPDAYCTLLVNLAETYFSEGNLEKAKSGFRHALDEVVRIGYDRSEQVGLLGSLGVIYRRQLMPDSAMVCYKQALKLAEGLKAYDEEAYLLTNIAILYTNSGRADEGAFYIRKAVDKAWVCDDIDMLLYACSSAGAIFSNAGLYAEAADNMHRVLDKARAQQKPRFMLKSLTYLVGLFQKTHQTDSLTHYLAEAEAVVPLLPENSAEVQGFRETQYDVLADLGRYRESLAVLERLVGEGVANVQTPPDGLYQAMARNHAALKNYRQAVDCYEQAIQASDSLRKAEQEAQLSEFTVKFKTQEKEIEIARLERERLEQKAYTMRWIFLAVSALLLLVLVAVYVVYRRSKEKKEGELKQAKRYIDGLESERKRLAKELHDGVCNDLLGVGMQMAYMDATEQSKQEVQQLLERIRHEVRCISHELMPPRFKHLSLVDLVEAYVEHMDCPESIHLHFKAEPETEDWGRIPENKAYEVYRIVQEWLSNVVRYSGATQVEVSLVLAGSRLELCITGDAGKEIENAGSLQGIGLSTIQERVKSLEAHLEVSTVDGKQCFRLCVSV